MRLRSNPSLDIDKGMSIRGKLSSRVATMLFSRQIKDHPDRTMKGDVDLSASLGDLRWLGPSCSDKWLTGGRMGLRWW